jgi:Flp pilus assembly protein TadG
MFARGGRLRRDTSGNVAITFAIALIPLLGMVGAAVDYTRANNYRTELLAAADSAAVGAVAKSSPAMAAAATMSADGTIPAGVTDGQNIFDGQISNKSTGRWSNLSRTVTVVRSNGQVASTVTFSASVPVTFLALLGKTSLTIGGTSKASNSLPTFIDFYLVLDNTPSMGLGATQADMNALQAATAGKAQDANCAFACHDLSGTSDWYTLAKAQNPPITMRIDVLRSATQELMDYAQSLEVYSNQFGMAIFTFGSSATNPQLTNIQPLTTNLSSAKTAAGSVDLMTVPYQNYRDDTQTDFGDILKSVNASTVIPTPGDGSSSGSPQKYLFFVSDGVADRALAIGSPTCSQPITLGADARTGVPVTRCQEPLDVSLCTAIKKRNIKIAVLYTTYYAVPGNSWYTSWIAPFSSQIATNMQSCASPGLYSEVQPGQGISDALKKLFATAVAEAHLTQ